MVASIVKTANILVIDDKPENLQLLSTILKERGYEVRCVTNGLIGLKVAKAGWAELILLDIKMPEINGYELCQRLKADETTKKIPVIFLSASDETFDKIQAFQVGGIDYITKPFQVEEVLVRVKNQILIQEAATKIDRLNEELEIKIKDRTLELEKANQQLQQEIQKRQQAQDRLLKLALNDSITGLPNRNSFLAKLKQALQKINNQPNYRCSVLLINCDRFQEIKCYLGHLYSNQLLMEIAHRLSSCLPDSALLSRFEGNEFAIFLDNIQQEQDAISIAEQIQEKFKSSFTISAPIPEVEVAQQDITVTCSMGIVISNAKYQTEYDLLQDAEIAVYQSAQSGQGNYQIFQAEISSQAYVTVAESNHKNSLAESELILKEAFRQKQFKVYYQPIFDLKNDQVIGVEALLRWQHPTKGIILPKDFLDIAETSSLIIGLGDLVFHHGCHQLKVLQQEHESQKNFILTINLSEKQLLHPNLLNKIEQISKQFNISREYLQLEITETTLVNNRQQLAGTLTSLKKDNIKLSINDFGIQENSLDFFRHFLIDNVKLDISLVTKIVDKNSSHETGAKIKQIIDLAHAKNITITAVGLENPSQLEYFKSLGCDYGQGYFFSGPLSSKSLEEFLVWRT